MIPKRNHLLEQLMDAEYQLLHQDLQLVSLDVGQVLFFPGGVIDTVYFPVNALIAIANEISNGLSMDMALIGSEGAAGLRGLFEPVCPYRVHVAYSGFAYKIALPYLRRILDSDAWLHKMYIQANHQIFGQIAAETMCAHFHGVPARVARWLLLRTRHVGQTYLDATHQCLADSLGVRREAVTIALGKLPGISGNRNRIDITDRSKLEDATCDCFHRHDDNLSGQLTLPFRKRT